MWGGTAFLGAVAIIVTGTALAADPAAKAPIGFTAEQAVNGQQAITNNCAACHGSTLAGGPGGPALVGAAFRARWRAQGGEALFAFVRDKMPPNAGHSLSDADYADATARILQLNGGKAGGEALLPDTEKLAARSFAASVSADAPIVLGPIHRPEVIPPDAIAKAAMAKLAERMAKLTPVTDAMLRNPPEGDWINWRGGYDAQGFSRLGQINRDNVAGLQVAWSWELAPSQNEITPLVHDGVMYVESGGRLQAIDAASGDLIWQYVRPGVSALLRNLAIYDNLIFLAAGTNMVALDMRDGHVVWESSLAAPEDGIAMNAGPLVAKGKIFQGMSNCHLPYPGGCFLVALDAKTGKEAWRFHSIARPGQPGGETWNDKPVDQRYGGSIWTAPSYDPDLDLLFVGTAQTYQTATLLRDAKGKPHPADGLYTNSTVALRPDSGEVVWHYQHFAGDVWDLDWAFERTLANIKVNGQTRRTITTAGKLTIFDTLDAATGKYLFSRDMGLQDLVSSIDPKTGAKTVAAKFKPEPDVLKVVCPSAVGGRNWAATAYNPDSGVLFVPMNDSCMNFRWVPGPTFDMVPFPVGRPNSDGKVGVVTAIDLASGKTLWSRRERASHSSAILATAGGLIFEGGRDRWFRASDEKTGKIVWQTRLSGVASSYPITYSVDGVQYVAVTTGGGGPVDGLLSQLTPEIQSPPSGTTLWVFRLPPP